MCSLGLLLGRVAGRSLVGSACLLLHLLRRRSLLLLLLLRVDLFGVSIFFKLHASEFCSEFTVSSVQSSGSDIWISLNDFQRALKNIDGGSQLLSALGHTWGLSQHACNSLVSVNSVPQVLLQLILGLLNEEVSNLLGHGITNTSQHNAEVLVDSGSNFLDESGLSAHLWGCLHRDGLTRGIECLLLCLRRFVLFEIHVVSEDVVLFSFDNGSHDL